MAAVHEASNVFNTHSYASGDQHCQNTQTSAKAPRPINSRCKSRGRFYVGEGALTETRPRLQIIVHLEKQSLLSRIGRPYTQG